MLNKWYWVILGLVKNTVDFLEKQVWARNYKSSKHLEVKQCQNHKELLLGHKMIASEWVRILLSNDQWFPGCREDW